MQRYGFIRRMDSAGDVHSFRTIPMSDSCLRLFVDVQLGPPPGREGGGKKDTPAPRRDKHIVKKNANLPSQATFSLPGNLLKLFYEIV